MRSSPPMCWQQMRSRSCRSGPPATASRTARSPKRAARGCSPRRSRRRCSPARSTSPCIPPRTWRRSSGRASSSAHAWSGRMCATCSFHGTRRPRRRCREGAHDRHRLAPARGAAPARPAGPADRTARAATCRRGMQRVEDGDFDATLLAAAGLKRLGLESHIAGLSAARCVSARLRAGRASPIECREADARDARRFSPPSIIARPRCRLPASAPSSPRSDGSCRTPIAGYAEVDGGSLRFAGMLLSADGQEFYAGERRRRCRRMPPRSGGRPARRSAAARRRRFLARLGIG